MHQPLSQSLVGLLNENNSASGSLTLNMLLERTHGRGLYLVMIFLSLPFVVPVSVPGLSTMLGITIMVLALRQALGKPPRLPKTLGEKPLPEQLKYRVLNSSAKLLANLEKLVRPRKTEWLTWRTAKVANSLLIALMAFLLALPLPAPPFFFTNSLPSYAIILIALSMMEQDGLVIWLGYIAATCTCAYFIFWADLILNHLTRWVSMLIAFLRLMQ